MENMPVQHSFKKTLLKYPETFVDLSSGATYTLIYLSGLGRYRVILVYALYFIVKSLLLNRQDIRLSYLLLPALAFALFRDVTLGPFVPIFEKNSLLFAIVIALICDIYMKRLATSMIYRLSHMKLFDVCPKCMYDNSELVEICAQCGYRNGDYLVASPLSRMSAKNGLSLEITNMAEIKDNEEVLYKKGGIPALTVLINGVRKNRILFMITTQNVVLLDYYRLPVGTARGYREKDIIPLKKIIKAEAKMKHFPMADLPFLSITTADNALYEVRVGPFGKYRKQLMDIIEILRKNNPNIETNVDLPPKTVLNDWKLF